MSIKRETIPGVHVDTRGKIMEYGIRLGENKSEKNLWPESKSSSRDFFI
jgi:hypothetical protein